MNIVHLTASTFYGGPERQMLGLADALPEYVQSTFAVFPEDGLGTQFLLAARARGYAAIQLQSDFPTLHASVREIRELLHGTSCDLLFCHGYKANILGRIAARRVGIPAAAVSRGWTGETARVKLYEWLDRRHLRWMDHVVCVSEGQAEKVRNWCGVPSTRLTVIRNSARIGELVNDRQSACERLLEYFPDRRVSVIVLAAGRLSPEKGFDVLVEAAATICREHTSAGVVIFGDGGLREALEHRIARLNLSGRVVLPGFEYNLDSLIAGADVVVLPSFTEGMPNVALEASAAGVPVVATAVGGTPEVVADGVSGLLVPPGEPELLAGKVNFLLDDAAARARMGSAGKRRMRELFTFDSQANEYLKLIRSLCSTPVEVVA